ncbi:protein-associating with the carboxyl-terminal domain of ezrin [Patella vulgata]|uniref:protein-associating with the carboxyl-terminal domain of ezrin n=1 Tax=Patella vulgata TaxID=6465 RepID=UPI00218071E9|nr:protein-associating with the carboxyl-terminal domain of ezrin [Patella vulgata]
MGAESSILSDCDWGDKFPLTNSHGDWTLQQAITQTGLAVSVFQHTRKDRKEIDILKKAAKHLKTLRHPSILRFIASGESSEGSYLVTEEVLPLESVLKQLTPIEISSGISEILDALVFLHDKVGICHNNICMSSIYVLQDGSWKLGGLEHCCKFEEATVQFLERCRAFRNEESISPEEKAGKTDNTLDFGHVRDVFSFGVFIEELFEKGDNLSEVEEDFEQRIHHECLHIEAKERPKLNTFLNDPLFNNDLIKIIKFLKNITLKTQNERKEFFSSLTSKLLALPEALVARRLTELLLSRFVLLDDQANKFLISNLLTPSKNNERSTSVKAGKVTPIFTRKIFQQHVIPLLTKIFYIREKHIRLVLLRNFSFYVDIFEPDVIHDKIFPHLLLGLRDSDDMIVAASLRALADVVPILGGDKVIGGSRKQFLSQGLPNFNNKTYVEELKIKTKNVEDVIGKKILLKDLAGMGTRNSAEDDKRQKQLEREKRREAARIKREVKKKRLAEEMETINGEMTRSEIRKSSDEITEINSNSLLLNGYNSTSSLQFKDIQLYVEEDRAADWSDWENPDTNDLEKDNHGIDSDSDSNFSESVISNEIENQLMKMPTTISKPQKSLEILANNSKVDKINSKNSKLKKSPLQLKKNKGDVSFKQSDVKTKDSDISYLEKDWGVGSFLVETAQNGNHLTKTDQSQILTDSRRSSTSNSSSNSRNLPKTSFNLGEEFEIKPVKIKVSDSFDFFADMVPQIQTKNKDPLLLLQTLSVDGQEQKTTAALNISTKSLEHCPKSLKSADEPSPSVKDNKFTMVTANNTADQGDGGDGWGNEDIDWGNEDF